MKRQCTEKTQDIKERSKFMKHSKLRPKFHIYRCSIYLPITHNPQEFIYRTDQLKKKQMDIRSLPFGATSKFSITYNLRRDTIAIFVVGLFATIFQNRRERT